MTNIIAVGRKLLPLDYIKFIEIFDPADCPEMRSARAFKARLVLQSLQSVLTEDSVEAFSEEHGLRALGADGLALNGATFFTVETFSPKSDFEPDKAYLSHLLWRHGSVIQSKLPLSEPEAVVAVFANARRWGGPNRAWPRRSTCPARGVSA